jgi:SecD/SecF fusion protein
MEKNLGPRWVLIGVVVLIGCVLIWPPSQKLRPGLDIAGGTSLIFEIDTSAAENDPSLAERVKTLLQKRVDPRGVYNLTWRVQGRNRIEVQMPLPPKEATERRLAYAEALDRLYSHELLRGQLEEALQLEGAERTAALDKLARGNADQQLGELPAENAATWQADIDQVVANRSALLKECATRFDALRAADEALKRGVPESQPATAPTEAAATEPASQPATQAASQPVTYEGLQQAQRDASELFEDSVQDVLNTNISRRRFEEILELDEASQTRKNSLAQVREMHADLLSAINDVVAKYSVWRSGKQYLESPNDLKRLLRGAGKLEFRILADPDPGNPARYQRYRDQLKEGRLRVPDEDLGWFKIDNPLQFFNFDSPAQLQAYRPADDHNYVVDKLENDYYVLAKLSPDDGLLQDVKGQRKWKLTRARIDRDEHGRWAVNFELDVVGGQYFETLTSHNIGKPLGILVDDVMYSAPNIRSTIRTNGQITGEFSLDKVQYLVQTMEGGMLPARLKDTPLSERTIGSSLGEANRDAAVKAGLIGTAAIIVIMIGYYRLCGVIANVAMIMNVFLTLAALAMLGARITLDGIAGLILSVGMAVDANVLIYERMREEKERGASLRMVIKNGYDRAFSTIFDSNMTTLLTCVIIYYVGSEEVKGFGLTLGWGIALNLFTAVFVTRVIFATLLKYNLIKDVHMLKLIGVPNINWYSKAKYLVPVTVLVTVVGVGLLFVRGRSNIFDIEFLGGVAGEFELKHAGLDDVTISKRIEKVAGDLMGDARRLDQASVEPVAGEASGMAVSLPGADGARLEALLLEPLEAANLLQRGRGASAPSANHWVVHVTGEVTAPQLAAKIHALSDPLYQACENLSRANVNAVLESGGVRRSGLVWNVTTTATNMHLFEYALKTAIGDQMRVQESVKYVKHFGDRPYPITQRLLDADVPGLPPGVNADMTNYLDGAAIYLDEMDPPQSTIALRQRIDDMLFQPDFQNMPKWRFDVIGVTPAGGTDDKENPLYSGVVIAAADPEIRFRDDPQAWYTGFVQPELHLIDTALTTQQSLRKVMQFKPQIAANATQQAAMALVLSWAMIVAYVWIRFGKLSYGMGGVVALIHDVLLALAFVGFSGWIAATLIGRALLVEDFKINMPIVAALLTIIGYSVNDTIVVFDRIRETRGRLGLVTADIVNASINQTLSRTIMTVFTVFVVIVIAYIFGGSSIRGFNYCMVVGALTGCYSSIAIASPLLLARYWLHRAPGLAPARAG